jgi:hypothetical protein
LKFLQQQAEAEGSGIALPCPVQPQFLFTGYTEIVDCREAIKKEQGSQFRLKQFHEKFLIMVVLQ